MKNKIYYCAVFVLMSIFQMNAQQDSLASDTPIQDEFTKIIEGSNNFQGYKVVDYDKLIRLKATTNTYINDLKADISTQKNTVEQQNAEIKELQNQLKTTQQNFEDVSEEKDALMFLGMPFSKSGYKAMMWGIVLVLLVMLVILFIRSKSSHSSIKESRQKLDETEKEFDAYRTKALEKEQRLGRMLQDERNRQNGVS